MTCRRILLATLCLLLPQSARTQQPANVTLTVARDSANYVLAVPISRLVMAIPRGSLRVIPQGNGGPKGPRYFFFEDPAQHMQISGWFESSEGYKDIQTFWKLETANWQRQHLPAPQNVSFVSIGNWKAILYDLAGPSGHDTNIRAHWVQAGTWIDIHLSMAGTTSPAALRRSLRQVLESIKVTQKTP